MPGAQICPPPPPYKLGLKNLLSTYTFEIYKTSTLLKAQAIEGGGRGIFLNLRCDTKDYKDCFIIAIGKSTCTKNGNQVRKNHKKDRHVFMFILAFSKYKD